MRLLALLVALAACGSNKVPHDLDVEHPKEQQANKPPPLTPVQTQPDPVAEPTRPARVAPTREPLAYKMSLFVHTALPKGTDPDSQIAIAHKENEDGIMSMKENNPSEATAQFRDAVSRVPNAVYYVNLCLSLYVEGKFNEGIAACDAVMKENPPAALQKTASGMRDRILWDAQQQNLVIQPEN